MKSAGHVLAGRYHIERHIGSGGMGQVYQAHDSMLGRRVAVRLLPPDSEADPVARERLRREARAAASLARRSTRTSRRSRIICIRRARPLISRVHRRPF
jgi:serine/threonine protein kinase